MFLQHEPGNTTVWMWEGPLAEQRLTLLDLETSKQRQTLEYDGEQVMCMTRVGSDIWIGNKVSNRGSYMSAHVLLNLLNELRKRDKMRGLLCCVIC